MKTTFTVWEPANQSEPPVPARSFNIVEADSAEEAAEAYVELLSQNGPLEQTEFQLCVRHPSGAGHAYFDVAVAVDWEPSFTAFEAILRKEGESHG